MERGQTLLHWSSRHSRSWKRRVEWISSEKDPYPRFDPHIYQTSGITKTRILAKEQIEFQNFTMVFFSQINYRPPSIRGEEIPLSTHTYNADPSKPAYHNYYHITNDTSTKWNVYIFKHKLFKSSRFLLGKLRKCNFRSNRSECGCSDADKLADDPEVSDCKEMVKHCIKFAPVFFYTFVVHNFL